MEEHASLTFTHSTVLSLCHFILFRSVRNGCFKCNSFLYEDILSGLSSVFGTIVTAQFSGIIPNLLLTWLMYSCNFSETSSLAVQQIDYRISCALIKKYFFPQGDWMFIGPQTSMCIRSSGFWARVIVFFGNVFLAIFPFMHFIHFNNLLHVSILIPNASFSRQSFITASGSLCPGHLCYRWTQFWWWYCLTLFTF